MQTRFAECHPDRKHKALGLCRQCYENTPGRRSSNQRRATCHPERSHAARGLCKPCYMVQYLSEYERPIASVNQRREASWCRRGISITVVQFDQLSAEQGGVCAICKIPSDKSLVVDHDHSTGKIRGLLCDYCNRRLLISRNTSEILLRASMYVAANTPAAAP